jgi:hypothetical protein
MLIDLNFGLGLAGQFGEYQEFASSYCHKLFSRLLPPNIIDIGRLKSCMRRNSEGIEVLPRIDAESTGFKEKVSKLARGLR